MSVTLSPSSSINFAIKNPINLQLKRELIDPGDFNDNGDNIQEKIDEQNHDSNHSSSDNSDASDLENNGSNTDGANDNIALDYTETALGLHPVADFIKKEFLPDFDFSNNLFRTQNMGFKADSFGNHTRSPFLLPTQLYKNFLATLGKRKRNTIADCYSLYPRNMLFSNNYGLDVSDDENNADRVTDSPDEEVILE